MARQVVLSQPTLQRLPRGPLPITTRSFHEVSAVHGPVLNLKCKSSVKPSKLNPLLLSSPLIAASEFYNVGSAEAISSCTKSLGSMDIGLSSGLVLGDMGSAWDSINNFLYTASQNANGLVQLQLDSLSPTSILVIFGAGLITSLSPCTLSVLPLTLGYIGAYGSGNDRKQSLVNSVTFSLGLATTLALLGVGASLAGKAYGQIGQGLPIAVSFLAIIMGLNLLEVVELQLPSFMSNFDPRTAAASLPPSVQAYLAGLTFALAASPCSTPVLATILGYVASTQDPLLGGGLLLAYTTGYVAPILLAASFAGALQRLLSFRKYSAWINPTSGALLIGGGIYTLLDRLLPSSMS